MKLKSKLPNGYKLFGQLYFIVQYLIIRIAILGFVLEPSLAQIMQGFRASEIVAAALNFYQLIVAAFALRRWYQIVYVFIPLAISFVWACRRVIIYIFVLVQLIMYIVGCARAARDKNGLQLNKHVVIRNGAPGEGKTRLTVYEVYYLAMIMWFKLQYIYLRDKSRVPYWTKKNDTVALADWKEVEESYKYYTTPQDINGKSVLPIPCLFSSIGVVDDDGRWASKLTFEHMAMERRLPSYTIEFIDEIGTACDVSLSMDKFKKDVQELPLKLSDDGRFIRQRRENIRFGTEQDANNMFNELRRVVGQNDYMQGCKDYLKPLPLVLLFNFLRWLFVKIKKMPKVFSFFMRVLERIIRSTGFVRFKYRPEGNVEHRQILEGLCKFTMPAYVSFRYDTRAFRFLNPCRDMVVSGELHTQLHIEDTPENHNAWLRAKPPESNPADIAAASAAARVDALSDTQVVTMLSRVKMLDERKKLTEKLVEYPDFTIGS